MPPFRSSRLSRSNGELTSYETTDYSACEALESFSHNDWMVLFAVPNAPNASFEEWCGIEAARQVRHLIHQHSGMRGGVDRSAQLFESYRLKWAMKYEKIFIHRCTSSAEPPNAPLQLHTPMNKVMLAALDRRQNNEELKFMEIQLKQAIARAETNNVTADGLSQVFSRVFDSMTPNLRGTIVKECFPLQRAVGVVMREEAKAYKKKIYEGQDHKGNIKRMEQKLMNGDADALKPESAVDFVDNMSRYYSVSYTVIR